jgi:hypothetical protein
MQICPWCMNDPNEPTDTAFSTSTSSRTMSAEFPPSSRCTRFECSAARRATIRPARVEPVKETSCTSGSATIASPTSAPPGSMLNRPAGRPASSKMRARVTPPHTAVRGSGLSSTALPSASAGATARMERISGALNGEITPTTPTGTRLVKLRCGWPVRRISPCGNAASPDASWHAVLAKWVWRGPNGGMHPLSRTIQPWISSA